MRHILLAALFLLAAHAAEAQTLRIGMQEEPDRLDPDLDSTFVSGLVFTALCDRLVDTKPDLSFEPRLATAWEWGEDRRAITFTLREDVTFHDGTPFDAAAVKFNLERSRDLEGSLRAAEMTSIEAIEAVDPKTVRVTFKTPDATFLATLADRLGIMISPKAAEAGADFSDTPVCSGPYRFVERVQNDRIVLEKFDAHWEAERYAFDEIVYRPIPDTTVRLANLRAGDLDMIERLAPSDFATVEQDASLQTATAPGLGYQGLTINLDNGPLGATPLGDDPRIREAIELALDRTIINQVSNEGRFTPGNQPFAPDSPWYHSGRPMPPRDLERAKALLAEAGFEGRLAINAKMINATEQQRLMQVVQAMLSEAGIDLTLEATEISALIADLSSGNYQMAQIGWAGRVDPDGNVAPFLASEGAINDTGFADQEVDRLIAEARAAPEPEARKALYARILDVSLAERPIIYLFHQAGLYALRRDLAGFVPHPDQMIRLRDMRFEQ